MKIPFIDYPSEPIAQDTHPREVYERLQKYAISLMKKYNVHIKLK